MAKVQGPVPKRLSGRCDRIHESTADRSSLSVKKISMKYYNITDNTCYERKWTIAVSIHPRSRMIEWSCPDCGAAASYPAGSFDVTIEGGEAYPDFLGCGAYPLMIVSGKVIASWEQHGIGPFVKFPVGVAAALETKLSLKDAPQYFRVEIAGDAKVDIPGSGGDFTRFCTRCGTFMTEPMLISKFALYAKSWDGSHVFRDQRLFPRVIFCTETVKRISESERHTNSRFEEMIPTPDN